MMDSPWNFLMLFVLVVTIAFGLQEIADAIDRLAEAVAESEGR